MSTIIRYSVWIRVEDIDTMDHADVHDAFAKIPGFVESSWEDSYDEQVR